MIDRESSLALGSSVTFNPHKSMEPRFHHTSWQYNVPQTVKREAMEDDSGINSAGSDFHSSSPGSDTSQELYHAQLQHQKRFFSTPATPQYNMNLYAHNPLTPPDSEPLVSPKSEDKDMDTTLTPCASPNKSDDNQDHIRRMEMSLEKLYTNKPAEQAVDESNSDNDVEDYEEQTWKLPKVNSHGKPKFLKCKQCDFVTDTKEKYWNHIAVHIPEEKRLTCPKCPFITEYKHHLEYHLRWHAGSKPFQCDKCDYSCVNKSMLNSHMKSHSSVYRYSCSDCTYATKYCHSLKIHLRRYTHRPNTVLDEDGKPCPDIIIDVYGTRRGPKLKHQQPNSKGEQLPPRPFGLNLLGAAASQQIPFPPYPFFGGFPNAEILKQLIQERQALLAASPQKSPPVEEEPNPMDLSKPGCSYTNEHRSRRKGPAFRIDPSTTPQSEDEEDDDASTSTTMFSNVEAVVQDDLKKEDVPTTPTSDKNNNKEENTTCQYCNISFGDLVLYTIHMGYHGFRNPFTCNMCGVECADKVTFFLHVARASH